MTGTSSPRSCWATTTPGASCSGGRWAAETSLAIAFFEIEAGRITKVTDFWPEPYEPPPGREHLVERW